MIESFVAECRETKPSWDKQRQIIGERICQLARHVEEEKSKLATISIDHAEDNEEIAQATKRSKNDATAADAVQQNIPIPTNLLELVEYILSVATNEQLAETKVGVFLQDNRKFYVESREDIQELLDKISVDDIDCVKLGGIRYSNEYLLEAYGWARRMFVLEAAIAHEISRTALLLASKYHEFPWDETLVVPMNEADLDLVKLVVDPSMGTALVVSGESGSGKTWFAQNYVPHKLGKQDLALIYHSLDSYDGYKRIHEDPQVKEYTMACHFSMCSLMDAGLGSGEVYDCVSKISMQYTCDRDASAYQWLQDTIGDFLRYDKSAQNWWSGSGSPTLEKMVIVIDEVDKNPELACGLITIARQVYEDIIVTNKKAKQVLLVLVGSGSDWYVQNHHLPYAGDDNSRSLFSTSGADPQKSNVIIMKGPNLPKSEIAGIPTSDILKGTYSSTLATNTRMLTRGILAVLTNSMFKNNPSTNSGSSGYADLGSTNVAMDHAARIYIELGGLSHFRDRPALLNKMLLKQFRLLLWERQFSIKESNPAAAKILEDLEIVGVDFHEALSMGIVTSDIKSTSPALRYLACNGFSAPNYAKDGIELDILLQHHLVRLCEAYHSCQDTTDRDPDKDANKYWAGQYTLKGEWPPTSSRRDKELRNPKITRNDVEKMYKALVERQLERDKPNVYEADIDSIINLVKNHEEFDLVMRQQPYCGQGARFIILKKEKGGKYSLDLFHSNNEMPGIKSMQFKKALQCLGVKLEENDDHHTINVAPASGSAGYTYYGTTVLAKRLGEKLGATVEIGQRTLILPKGWDGERADVEFLQKAMEKGLMVWTPEMLEPTISTFKSK